MTSQNRVRSSASPSGSERSEPFRINRFILRNARGIVGMDPEEVRPFLEDLLEQAVRPENSLRHKWQSGDVLMFDNRCTMHRPDLEYDMSEERLL